MRQNKKRVFEPFKNPYEGHALLDTESICSEPDNVDLEHLDIKGLRELEYTLLESLSTWDDILYDDMGRYRDSLFENDSAKSDVSSDRRQIQLLKVELREVRRRIRMMMNTERRELIVA